MYHVSYTAVVMEDFHFFLAKSLSLESAFKAKISERINEKVLASDGTWIDWQYLTDVVNVLTKCR